MNSNFEGHIYFADDNLGRIFVMGFTGGLPMECVVMKENSKMKISQTVYVTGFASNYKYLEIQFWNIQFS